MLDTKEEYTIPDLQCTITTYELIGEDKWVAILSHTFHGSTQEELFAIMKAHKESDSFFRSSFEGEFEWKGGIIHLINSEPKVDYP
jgi:hypothetical protein